jgi:Stage II sporulation protein E (SpoIIE)
VAWSLVVLGDVCGKGLEAAMLTGKIRNTLQASTPVAADHQAVPELLDRLMLSTGHARFATLVLASAANRHGGAALEFLGKHLHDLPRSRSLPAPAQSAFADKRSSATDPQLNR